MITRYTKTNLYFLSSIHKIKCLETNSFTKNLIPTKIHKIRWIDIISSRELDN